MAKYRQVHVSFWQDSFVLDLTPEEKYFYIYLMTNSKTTQCGIYELPIKIIEIETGYNRETVLKLIDKFEQYKRVKYSKETNEVFMLNWLKYNFINSKKVITCIEKELEEVKNKDFVKIFDTLCIRYGYPIDRPCIDSGEEEEENKNRIRREEKRREENNSSANKPADTPESSHPPYDEILNNYNSICQTLPTAKKITDKRRKHIKSAWIKFDKDILKFNTVFEMAEESDFLSGRSGKWTGCNFDWLITYNNMIKVIEGTYDNKQTRNKDDPKRIPRAYAGLMNLKDEGG